MRLMNLLILLDQNVEIKKKRKHSLNKRLKGRQATTHSTALKILTP